MFLQAIVIDDDAYEIEKAARSFANKHVFPGGCLPSLRLIAELGARDRDARRERCDDITAHYARTLELWRERFNAPGPSCAPLGYDERFARLWNFYLAFSEAGFRERRIRDLQIVLAKPGWRAERTTRWRSRHSRAGSGEPLVLIHGLGGSRRIWEPVHRPARRRARRDRRRPAGLRRLARASRRASRRRRPTSAPRSASSAPSSGSSVRTWPATRSAPGWRSSSPRPGRRPRSARSRPPASGGGRSDRGGSTRTRWAARLRPAARRCSCSSAARAAALPAHDGRPPGAADRARRPGRWSATGSTPPATTAANGEMRAHVFEHPELVTVPTTIAWGTEDRLVGPPSASGCRRERATSSSTGSATRRPGTTRRASPSCCSKRAAALRWRPGAPRRARRRSPCRSSGARSGR